jgi:hypothetical protein
MFCRLKDARRIATRYDKCANNFLSAVCLVSYLLLVKLSRRSGESSKGGLCGLSPRGLWLCRRRGLCPGPGLGPLFTPRRTVDLNGGAIDSVLVMCADNLA